MEIEKGKTAINLRKTREVPQELKDNLKEFNRIKKAILEALKEGDLTIKQLSQELNMNRPDVVYYLMSLVKYGFVQTGEVDDMDEYFTYKLKK
jgi:predicted transcriptional regulator